MVIKPPNGLAAIGRGATVGRRTGDCVPAAAIIESGVGLAVAVLVDVSYPPAAGLEM